MTLAARSRGTLSLAVFTTGFLATGLLASSGLAAEKGGPLFLRVTDDEGHVLEGHAHYKKDGVEVEATSGMKKVLYSKVASLEEVDPDAPPPGSDPAKDREDFETRAKALEERNQKPADGDKPRDPGESVAAWIKLGHWAQRRALVPEARRCFDKVLALRPDDAEARKAIGEAKDDDGTWKPARQVFEPKAAKAGKERKALYEVGRWAAKNGLDDDAIAVLGDFVWKDPYNKELLPFLRPITDRRWQTTRLRFPLNGRWKASADPTHHHELKSYAVYAIDFYREVDGKQFRGDGKNLEDWCSFGQPIYAAADGEVCEVREGFPDNPINQLEGKQEKHNMVGILHESVTDPRSEITWYVHTQKGSIVVKKGDQVKKGQLIARVGNSGGSAAPHLHFTLVATRFSISVPWRFDGYTLLTEDGTRVHVNRGHPIEGQSIEGEPEIPADAPPGAH